MSETREVAWRHRSLVTAGAASVLHLALLLLAWRASSLRTVQHPAAEEATGEITITEITVLEAPSPSRAERGPAEPASREGASTRSEQTRVPTPTTEAPSSAPGAPEPGPEGVVGEPSTPMLFIPTPGEIGLSGHGTTNPFFRPGALPDPSPAQVAEASPTGNGKRAAEQSIKDAMRARDVGVGLGPEGPVLRALQDATYGGLAPDRGSATFLAIIDTNGVVIDLRLLKSRGGDDGWADARDRAKQALSGSKIALRGARGAELRIEVDSDVRLPSGNRPDAPPVQPELTPSKITIQTNAPQDSTSSTVQSLTVGRFDVTDFKAKARRIVHTRLVSMSNF